jgi:hypothetical protein
MPNRMAKKRSETESLGHSDLQVRKIELKNGSGIAAARKVCPADIDLLARQKGDEQRVVNAPESGGAVDELAIHRSRQYLKLPTLRICVAITTRGWI